MTNSGEIWGLRLSDEPMQCALGFEEQMTLNELAHYATSVTERSQRNSTPVPEHGCREFPGGVIECSAWAELLRSDDLDPVILIVDIGLIANSDAALVMGVWAGRGRIPGVRCRRGELIGRPLLACSGSWSSPMKRLILGTTNTPECPRRRSATRPSIAPTSILAAPPGDLVIHASHRGLPLFEWAGAVSVTSPPRGPADRVGPRRVTPIVSTSSAVAR